MSQHTAHILEAAAFMAVTLGGIAATETLQQRRNRDRPDTERASEPAPSGRATVLPLVGLASAGAASVHLVVMPEHFGESALYGSFFAVTATLQLSYAVLTMARPRRSLLIGGLIGNAMVILLWLVTRTAGIPLGPASGSIEEVSGLDLLATAFEATVVACTAIALRRPRQRPVLRPRTWSGLAIGYVALSGLLVPVVALRWPPS